MLNLLQKLAAAALLLLMCNRCKQDFLLILVRLKNWNCNAIPEVYRLINLTCLNDVLGNVHQCVGARLTVVDTSVRHGLCSNLSFMCLKCGIKTKWDTSQHINRDHGQA